MFKLPAKTVTEKKVVTFDFTNQAATGTTLSGPAITVTMISPSDGTPGDLIVGTPSVSGKKILALVSVGLEGSTYKLFCEVQASNGEVHDISASMLISASAV